MQFYVPEVKDVEEVKDGSDDMVELQLKTLEKKIGDTE